MVLRLRIFTNQTCSLCRTAKQKMDMVKLKVPFTMEEVDINKKGNEQYQKYCFDVPVITVVGKKGDEEIVGMHRVDEIKMIDKLKKILNKSIE